MLLYPIKKLTESDGGMSWGCCLGLLVVLVISFLVKAVLIQFAWNYGVVDVLEISSTTITFWQAMIVSFVLSLITG